MSQLHREFANPPAAYRGKPFWAWNGKLDEGELRRQVRVMHQMGLGGFFMHSRVGLATQYLSDEWFDMIRACVDEAKKLDMEAWLYDEDRWPSGAAGGLVTCHEEYRRRSLVMLIGEPSEWDLDGEPIAVFSAEVQNRTVRDWQRLEGMQDIDEVPDGREVLAFVVKIDEPSPWYNGYTYLDTLNHDAVNEFIETTHEAYRREVGEDFGNIIPGIFTDEPNYGTVMHSASTGGVDGDAVPWTGSLPETFRERYGYDVLERLPEIFLDPDGEPVSQVRWHYMDCITFLFTDAFGRQIGDWCQDNDLEYTGHVLAEATLQSQTSVVGSSMRFYEHMQAQGIDILTEHNQEYGTAKQCSSVQHQMGRRWVLSETYGCTGWDFSFEGHKAIGDWQAALGINLRCQHLSWYTMEGQAKRDYPASIHYQSPWWPFYGKVEDYFARINTLTSRGHAVRPLLVIHPIESVWALAGREWGEHEVVKDLDEKHRQLRRWLLEEHVDFDYGDEDMLDRWGEVATGEENVELRLCEARYDAVVVPPMVTMRNSTRDLLKRFAETGGRVIFIGDPPAYVDALPADPDSFSFRDEATMVSWDRESVTEVAAGAARRVSIRDEQGREHTDVLYLLHRDGSELYLFMCNTNREAPTGPLTVEVEHEGPVAMWDPETGDRFAVDSDMEDAGIVFSCEMPASGSRLYVVGGEVEDLAERPLLETRTMEQLGTDDWAIQLSEPNVLVLDYFSYRVEDGAWDGPEEVLSVDKTVREDVGLPLRGGQMVQPWMQDKQGGGTSADLELSCTFAVEQPPDGDVYLAMEQPGRFAVTLNGHPIPTEAECGWWVDRSLRLIPIDPAILKKGVNELRLDGTYDSRAGLETMFLLGDFTVDLDGNEATLRRASRPGFGDWTQEGFPFYTGAVTYRRSISLKTEETDRVFVELPELKATCARVLVDGKEAGIAAWDPMEVEITDLVQGTSEVELAVEVVSHRRNAFGPLHHVEKWPRWTGPAEYVTSGDEWQDDYNLVPCGCLEPPVISYRTHG